MMRTGIVFFLVVAHSIATPAQSAPAAAGGRATVPAARVVAVGDTVRLFTAERDPIRGILSHADSAGMMVTPETGGDPAYIGLNTITHAEVRQGARLRGAAAFGKSVLVGLGLAAGVTALALAGRTGHEDGLLFALTAFVDCTAILASTLIGAIVATTEVDIWIPFDVTTLRVGGAATE